MRYFASAFALAAGLGVLPGHAAGTISGDVVRIGVINDQSGAYSDYQGPDRSRPPVWPLRTSAAR